MNCLYNLLKWRLSNCWNVLSTSEITEPSGSYYLLCIIRIGHLYNMRELLNYECACFMEMLIKTGDIDFFAVKWLIHFFKVTIYMIIVPVM